MSKQCKLVPVKKLLIENSFHNQYIFYETEFETTSDKTEDETETLFTAPQKILDDFFN